MKRAFTLIELLVVIAIVAILAAILFPVFAQAKAAAKKTQCLSSVKQWALAFNMYAGDVDDRLPCQSYNTTNAAWAKLQPAYSWQSVIQPYAEKAEGDASLRTGNRDLKSRLSICPSQPNKEWVGRTGVATTDISGVVRLSYGMPEWATGGMVASVDEMKLEASGQPFRNMSSFNAVAESVLLGEQGMNFNQVVAYPIANDDNILAQYSWKRVMKDHVVWTLPIKNLNNDANTGTNMVSNHTGHTNFAFVDGHAKSMKPEATYKADGSYSMWTLSNTWKYDAADKPGYSG